MTRSLHVKGMGCSHCVEQVSSALRQLEGVEDASVSLETETAEVTLAATVDDEALIAAIRNVGYDAEVSPSSG